MSEPRIPGVVAEALARGRPPGLVAGAGREALRADVERAADWLRPCIEAAIADAGVSHDHALAIVVVDPAAPHDAPLDEAIVARLAFGEAGRVAVDYERYARDKARASHRERCDTATLRERGAALTSELPLVGGLHRRGLTLGVSGAVPEFDEAIGAMFIELVHALQVHRRRDAPTSPEA